MIKMEPRENGDSGAYIGGSGEDAWHLLHIYDIQHSPTAKLIESPIETGGVMFDNKVQNPIRVTVKGWVRGKDSEELFATANRYYKSRSQKDVVTIFTKTMVYGNMCLVEMPTHESAEKLTIYDVTFGFTQLMLVKGQPKTGSPDEAPRTYLGNLA